MQDVNKRQNASGVGGKYGNSVLPAQFVYKPKATLIIYFFKVMDVYLYKNKSAMLTSIFGT